MNKYVVQGIAIDHDGKRYQPGDSIDLDAKEAKRLARWIKAEPAPHTGKNTHTGAKK